MDGSRLALLAAALLLGACLRLPLPFTAAQLHEASTRLPPGRVLVHYLGQANADPAVCDLDGPGARLARMDEAGLDQLVEALLSGKVRAATWQRCSALLLSSCSEPLATHLLSAMADAVVDRLPEADADQGLAERLDALVAVIGGRSAPKDLPLGLAAVLTRLDEKLRAAMEKSPGPAARRLCAALAEVVEMDLGRFHGAAVTPALLQGLADEPALLRLAARLPSSELRRAAKQRVIRLHIEASPFREVRERAAQVEQTVLEQGRNPIAPAVSAVRRVWTWAPQQGGVLVRQDLRRQRATLLYRGAQSGQEVLPTLDLSGLLLFEVDGISKPVTLCAPPARLLVEPCLDSRMLDLGNPVVRLDADGVVHFVEDTPLAALATLLDPGTGFEVKPTLDGAVLATLALPLWFERPDELAFEGRAGGRGPAVEVVADPYPGRLLLTARPSGGEPFLAILERRDAAGFRLVSRGGAGTAGSSGYRGSDGVTGAAGTPASCPGSPGGTGGQGGSGGRGGDGGPGGRGGDGGEVSVELRCRGDGCDELTGLLRVIVQSEGGAGGPGGPGGSGGSGGSGGMGGSGTSCYADGHTSYVSGGGTGARGSDGSAGNNGMPGPRGADGSVALRRTP